MSAYIAAYIVLICLSAFFSSSEMCFSSANRMRLESAAEGGNRGAKIALKVMDKFDDSLSAVDAETDAKIRAALHESLGKATVLLISHRVTTLMQADCILVLDGGRVSELGTHAELIAKPGIYRDIYDIQMSSDDRRLLGKEGV